MKKNLSIILLFFVVVILTGCTPKKNIVRSYTLDPTFGDLVVTVALAAPEDQFVGREDLRESLSAITNELDALYSTTKETSYIKKINDNAGVLPVVVTDEVIFILESANEASRLSTVEEVALYDVTIAPIVDLWNINELGFTKTFEYADIPTNESIQQLIPLIGYNNIVIDKTNKTVFLKNVGMKIDLGSILKGYAADKLKKYLVEQGFENGVINVSGNVLTFGKNITYKEPVKWKIGISKPYTHFNEPDRVGSVMFDNITAVSSGIYERYILTIEDNKEKEYHHIFDPRTGYPVDNDLMHVSIFTNLSITGDALSTVVFSMGLELGYGLVESLNDVDALFITKNKEIYITAGLVDNFVYNDAVTSLGYQYKGVMNGTGN